MSRKSVRPGDSDLRRRLAAQRPLTSLVDREIVAASEIVPHHENWVRALVDEGHAISFDGGRTTARRAISSAGLLLWLVSREGKRHAYHALPADPLAAVREAEGAWAARRAVRARWPEIEAAAADLRAGRRRFRVSMDDAYASPLCTLGIEGYMSRLGMGQVRSIPGWLAGWLMLGEPQMGFVIDEAVRRVDAHLAGRRLPVPA